MGTLTEQERTFLDNTKRGIDNLGFGIFLNNVNRLVAIIDRLTTPEAQPVGIKVSVGRMQESNGRVTWSVSLQKGEPKDALDFGFQVYSSESEGRARHCAAEYEHVLNDGPEPDILAFDTDLPTPSAPLSGAVESDAEVAEIEKRHAHDIERIRHVAGAAESRGPDLCAQGWRESHSDRATLLRKLRQAPAAQMVADEERLAEWFLASSYDDDNDLSSSSEDVAAKFAKALLSSGVVKQIDRKQLARWFFDHELSNHGLKFEEEPDETESAYEMADSFIADVPKYEILALFRAPDEVKREGS